MTRVIIRGVRAALLLVLAGAATGAAGPLPIACLPAGVSCEGAAVGFEPAYPSGTGYEIFMFDLAQRPFFEDSDGDGALNDERCDTNREGELAAVNSTLAEIIAVGNACEALPSGPNYPCATPPVVPAPGAQEFCTMALGFVAMALEANAIFITRCDMQADFVNGAETEATYENTKLVLSRDLEERLRACDKLVSLFLPRAVGGRLEEVRDLVALRVRQYEQADALSAEDWSKDIGRAKRKLDIGDARYADQNYKEAYRGYCDAYRELRDIHL